MKEIERKTPKKEKKNSSVQKRGRAGPLILLVGEKECGLSLFVSLERTIKAQRKIGEGPLWEGKRNNTRIKKKT